MNYKEQKTNKVWPIYYIRWNSRKGKDPKIWRYDV